MKILAQIIQITCHFLKNVADAGAVYGNLRIENILVKLDTAKTKVEGIKFLNVGHVIEIESAQNIVIPD